MPREGRCRGARADGRRGSSCRERMLAPCAARRCWLAQALRSLTRKLHRSRLSAHRISPPTLATNTGDIMLARFLAIGIIAAAAFLPSLSAHAFCGFFVGKADATLFNDASK